MKIAVSGPALLHKSEFIDDFAEVWPMYKKVSLLTKSDRIEFFNPVTYSIEKQRDILNRIINTLKEHKKEKYVIYDLSPLDNLLYTLWCYDKQLTEFNDEFVVDTILNVREALKMLDIVFILPLSKFNYTTSFLKATEKEKLFLEEYSNLQNKLYQYYIGREDSPFFPMEDCPGLIEIFGEREQRTSLVQLYLDKNGNLIGGETQSTDLVNPQFSHLMESILESNEQILNNDPIKQFKDSLIKPHK